MVKFLKPGKVVIILAGKHAGRKAVIVKNFDEGTKARPYPHAVLAGIKRYPKAIKKSMTKKQILKKIAVGVFTKTTNYEHFFPTRYALDIDFKPIITSDALEVGKRKRTASKVRKVLEERYKTGKNKWFFTKLRF